MKSLIEESSSIAKAIEKGWERAGKPQSFSVKVYELPEKNFLGITTKYAKIGIFFSEEKPQSSQHNNSFSHKKDGSSSSKNKKSDKGTQLEQSASAEQKAPRETARTQPKPKQPAVQPIREQKPKNNVSTAPLTAIKGEATIVWSDEMVGFITNWLRNSLAIMDLASLNFTTTVAQNHLKVHFERPLVPNAKQAQLFRGLSYIIMASIRAKFKTDLKGLRVMFSCE